MTSQTSQNNFTAEVAERVLEMQGAIVDIGQVGPAMKRALERRVRSGELIKYRGYWNTLSPVWGIGPLKTIYARVPASAAA